LAFEFLFSTWGEFNVKNKEIVKNLSEGVLSTEIALPQKHDIWKNWHK
jgi:hypothetical protein